MNMYKSIIVDDDPFSAGVIANYCNRSPELLLHKQYTDPQQALDALSLDPVDLVFLDVEMPGINGFDLLDQLQYRPKVILISSKTQYAFPAFEYHVIDFLKKPVLFPRFREAIEKLLQFQPVTADKPLPAEEIFIKSDGRMIKIPYDSILYLEVLDDYVKIVTDQGSHLVLSTLKQIEVKLNHQFIKTHRSFIVNKNRIEQFAEGKVHLGPKTIPISKGNKAKVMKSINML